MIQRTFEQKTGMQKARAPCCPSG